VLSSSSRIFMMAFLPAGLLALGGIMAGPLFGAELLLLGLLFLVAMALLQRTLFTMQLARARDLLQRKAETGAFDPAALQHDPLTGLLNRLGLELWLQERLDAGESTTPALVTLATVLGFGELNALYGNKVADAVLRELATRLQREARGMIGVTRISGTEFILVDLRPLANHEDLLAMLTALEHEPFKIDEQTVALGFRKVWVRGRAKELDTLIDHARTQLRTLPAEGSTEKRSADVSLTLRRELVQGFHQALAAEQIQPWFQPVVDCRSNRIIGWEALARWQHPQHGPIDPDTFLIIARVSRQLPLLSRSIFRTSALLIRALCEQGQQKSANVHVNLSADELGKVGTLTWIEQILQEAGVSPEHFVIELSEQDAPVLDEQLRQNLLRMHEIGMQLALDDFGTGHANLDRLLDLPVAVMKLDKRFITKLPEDPASITLVQTLISMAAKLKLQTIAEGVETDAQLAFLREQGCNAYQGFRAGKALPFQQALDLAHNWPVAQGIIAAAQ
jgi:diguanylate cyclase (GGDEF)-like protein